MKPVPARVKRLARAAMPMLLLLGLVLWALAHHSALREATRALGRVSLGWLTLALASQLLCVSAASLVPRALLAPVARVPYLAAQLIVYGATTLSSVIPGGYAASLALMIRRYQFFGASPDAAIAAVVVAGPLSSMVLIVLAIGAALATGALSWLAAGLLLGIIALGFVLVAWQRERVARLLARVSRFVRTRLASALLDARRVSAEPAANPATLALAPAPADPASSPAELVAGMLPLTRTSLLTATGWSFFNWSLDALCLYAATRAVGLMLPLIVVLGAYTLAKLVTVVPIIPGGLGVVDGTLISVLATGGASAGLAGAAALLYRALSLALVAVLGALALLILPRLKTPTQRQPAEP